MLIFPHQWKLNGSHFSKIEKFFVKFYRFHQYQYNKYDDGQLQSYYFIFLLKFVTVNLTILLTK